MSDRVQVWSSGGGTQSAAIAALVCKGELRPDLAVIIDTEREVETTWKYHDEVIVPALQAVGVTLHRVPKSRYATVDLYSKTGKLLLPAYTNKRGKLGRLPTYCSNEWKSRVVQRWCREMRPDARGFDIWLGISIDESDRMRVGFKGKWQYKHPLIDDRRLMSRTACAALVRSMGWPDPPRSRCYMCPNQRAAEWDELTRADAAKADALQAHILLKDPNALLRGEGGGSCMSGMCFV